jgi:hypothetical protein
MEYYTGIVHDIDTDTDTDNKNTAIIFDEYEISSTVIETKLNKYKNDLTLLTYKRNKKYSMYANIIYNNKRIQEKIDVYKNILDFKHIRNNSAFTFASLHKQHIHSLLNYQIRIYNKNFKKINKLVLQLDNIDVLIDKINIKILFI